jgi:uncharacterized protein YndB with AHSA1/START domain
MVCFWPPLALRSSGGRGENKQGTMNGTAENGWELSITRHIDAPTAKVWQIITDRLAEWWCPKPWRTEIIALDWVSGGEFHTAMYGPEPGQESSAGGKMLEVIPGQRFVFTDAFSSGWIPQKPFMVGSIEILPEGEGTRYTAWAKHWDEAAMKQHKDMGFADGWNEVANQLAALCESG